MTWGFAVKWALFVAWHRTAAAVSLAMLLGVALVQRLVEWCSDDARALWAQYLRWEKRRRAVWLFERWAEPFERDVPARRAGRSRLFRDD